MIKRFYNWVVRSSADPKKTSLTIRAAGLALIPTAISILSTACGFGLVCLGVDAQGLNEVVETVASIIEAVLIVLSGLLFLAGFLRKLFLTATGQNLN